MQTTISIFTKADLKGKVHLLYKEIFDCQTPIEARKLVDQMLHTIDGAQDGYFSLPQYWNQNIREAWVSKTFPPIIAPYMPKYHFS